jgi:hypothetical protein
MQEAALTYTSPIAYKDLYLRLIVCVIATHIVIVYGETASTFEILLTQEYYYAFAGSFIIAFLLFGSVRSLFIRLDKNFDWMQEPIYRIGLQMFFGLMIPGLLAFLLAAMYFRLNGINILDTSYLRYDFQFILLQILIINCYYIAYYFYGRWSQAKDVINRMKKTAPIVNEAVKDTFQVSKGAANVLLGMDQIAYCYRKDESNFLRTVTGEDFYINLSLDEVQEQLPERNFFRINRQMIAHRQTCKRYDLLSYGKLRAELHPSFNAEVIISQKRALAFKNWIQESAS